MTRLFDSKISMNTKSCGFCTVKLTEENTSEIRPTIADKNNKPKLVCMCLICAEVMKRLFESQYIENGVMCFFKTEKQIREEVYREGWTMETLRASEEKQFEIVH